MPRKANSVNYAQRRRLRGLSHKWSSGLRKYVEARDDGMCVYCGMPGLELDHVVPSSHGGPTIAGNAVLACRSCNRRKSNLYPLEMLIRAFIHLLVKGEDIYWLEDIWRKKHELEGARR